MKIISSTISPNGNNHKVFGGWLSDVFQSRMKAKKSQESAETFRSRNLLNIGRKTYATKKPKILSNPKKPIVIKQEGDDKDYENVRYVLNYFY